MLVWKSGHPVQRRRDNNIFVSGRSLHTLQLQNSLSTEVLLNLRNKYILWLPSQEQPQLCWAPAYAFGRFKFKTL